MSWLMNCDTFVKSSCDSHQAQWVLATSVMDKTLLEQFVSVDEIDDRDTPVPCYVVHLLDMDVSVHQRLLDSVNNLTEDSEEAEDDDSDDNVNTNTSQACSHFRRNALPCRFKRLYVDSKEICA